MSASLTLHVRNCNAAIIAVGSIHGVHTRVPKIGPVKQCSSMKSYNL